MTTISSPSLQASANQHRHKGVRRPGASAPWLTPSAIQRAQRPQRQASDRARFGTWASLAGTLLALGLAACGGSGNDQPSVVAGNDTLTVNLGQSANLLANDSLGGAAATTGAGGNVTFTFSSGALPAGVTSDSGQLAVDSSTTPGSFIFGYTICEAANTSNCASANVQVTLPPPVIVAGADTLALAAGAIGDLLANDTLGGAPATAAMVSATGASLPAGVTLSAAGLVSVASTVAGGTYSFNYSICQLIVPANCATGSASVTVPALGSLSGRAVSSTTGLGIAGVTVAAAGVSAVTDAGGNFSIVGVPQSDRIGVLFLSAGYGPTARIASIEGNRTSSVQARLVPVSASVVAAATAGGIVNVPGLTAQVVIAANSLQRADGSALTGNATVRVTPVDPSSDTTLLPGDFTTLLAGLAAQLESFGALIVQIVDQAGAQLSLQAGRTLNLRIPLATRSGTAPATVPMYYFDEAIARWVQQGTATLAGSGASRYYQATVDRLGTWTAGQSYNTVRVSGCVADAAGVRVAGASVAADGIDYSGSTTATTDAGGNFVLPIRLGGRVAVTGVASGRLTNTLPLGPYAGDTAVTNCLALGQAGGGVTMKLTWGAAPGDLDAHLYAPDGSHVYYANRGSQISAPFASLDVDDVTSFGPEVITVSRLMVGTYRYAVNNFDGQSAGLFSASGARVELNVPTRAVELFAPPSAGETLFTNWWNLFEFDVSTNCTVTVRRTSVLSTRAPTSTANVVPTYCTP